jgi:hypothetical protein
MSGQWGGTEEKLAEVTSCFPRLRPNGILEEIIEQDKLIAKVHRLTAYEAEIVSVYVDNLLKTRPIRERYED